MNAPDFDQCRSCEMRSACRAARRCAQAYNAKEAQEPSQTAVLWLYLLEHAPDEAGAVPRAQLLDGVAGTSPSHAQLSAMAQFGTIAQAGAEQGTIRYYVDGDCKVPSTLRLAQVAEAWARRNQRRSNR